MFSETGCSKYENVIMGENEVSIFEKVPTKNQSSSCFLRTLSLAAQRCNCDTKPHHAGSNLQDITAGLPETLFILPEMLLALKSERMPNHINT